MLKLSLHRVLLFLLCSIQLRAAEQDSSALTAVPKDSNRINWYVLAPLGALSGGLFAYSQVKQSTAYWGDRTSFYWNVRNDWQYAHGGDKFGHAYFANLLAITSREAMILGGMDTTSAVWWGWGVSLFHQSIIEVQDGFSTGAGGVFEPYLGFSWGDFTANVLGASFPVAQHYSPFLRNFHYKFSLNPSAKMRQGGYYSSMMDDYESKYHWLSIDIYHLLPASAKPYWTPLLNIAVGHSVKDIVDAPNHYTYNGYHELWLSLDYNLEALPGDAGWWKSLKKLLNLYKLPTPCVRLLPNVVWYGLRW